MAALGYFYLLEKSNNKLKSILTLIIFLFTAYSCFLNLQAASTIGKRSVDDEKKLLTEFTESYQDAKILFSGKIQEQLKMPDNITNDEYTYLAYYLSEVPPGASVANIRGQFAAMLGPQDINIDYYPNWCGRDRILIMEKKFVTDSIYFYTIKQQRTAISSDQNTAMP